MYWKTSTLSATLLAFGLAQPGLAQGAGELTLTLSGEERIVPLWGSQSDWSGAESWPSVNIYARAFNEDGEDPLVVSLGFDAPGWTPGRTELQLTDYENGEVAMRLFAGEDEDEGALSVTIDSHALDGPALTLTGRFEGTMGPSDNFGRDIDLSEGVPVEGSFAVTLEKLD